MYQRFKRLDKDQSGRLSAEELLAIPEFASNPLASNRLVPIFLHEIDDGPEPGLFRRGPRPAGTKDVSFRGFIKFLSVFHARASIKEKLQCTHRVLLRRFGLAV